MIAPFDERETIDKGFMHYYQFNIGDYASHTRHLDLLEDLAYRRILDLYYLHEKPLEDVSPVIAKKIGMKEHAELVSSVLQEFFVLTDQGWVNPRADKEIAHYKSKVEQASRAGKASAERRLNGRSTDSATDVQPNNKHKPININKPPKSPKGDSITFDTWIAKCKEANEKPIPENDKVFGYIKEVGLPVEYLRLHWGEFKDRYSGQAKRYIDWKRTFLNSVKSNWFKLWFIDNNGEYLLTTQGKQAERKAA